MKRLLISIAATLALLGAEPLAAQTSSTSPSAELREISGRLTQSDAPTEPVQLGEPIPLKLEIAHPPKVDVTVPSTFGSDRWELLDSSRSVVEAENEWVTTIDMRFGVFRPGETTLASFPIELSSTDGEGVLMTRPMTVKVLSSLEDDEEKFGAPRPPVTMWVEDHSLAWGGGIAGLALLFGLFLLAMRRRQGEVVVAAPPRPAHEVALARLGELAGDDLMERGEYMVFYVLLSETIREYLGRRYGFKAVEMTTTEILGALERARVKWPNSISREDVADFLLHCDAVKFGGLVPSVEVAEERLRRAFTIVEATRARPIAAQPAATEPAQTEPEQEVEEDSDARWRPPADSQAESTEAPNSDDETDEHLEAEAHDGE